jgi:hypothetical protein
MSQSSRDRSNEQVSSSDRGSTRASPASSRPNSLPIRSRASTRPRPSGVTRTNSPRKRPQGKGRQRHPCARASRSLISGSSRRSRNHAPPARRRRCLSATVDRLPRRRTRREPSEIESRELHKLNPRLQAPFNGTYVSPLRACLAGEPRTAGQQLVSAGDPSRVRGGHDLETWRPPGGAWTVVLVPQVLRELDTLKMRSGNVGEKADGVIRRVKECDLTPVVRSGACESSRRPRSWTRRERSREAAQAHPRAGHPQAARS